MARRRAASIVALAMAVLLSGCIWEIEVKAATPEGVLSLGEGGRVELRPATCADDGCPPTRCTPPSSGGVFDVAIASGLAYVAAFDSVAAYSLACVDSCEPLWSTPVDDWPHDIVVSDGRLIVSTFDGDVTAYGPASP